jgi:hypothetical protein
MALRDWRPWQIAAMWAVGIVLLAVLLRRGLSWFTGDAGSEGIFSISVSVLPSLAALVILAGLIAATISWMRRAE